MSYQLLHQLSRSGSAEYRDDPSVSIRCAKCGTVWDVDDDEGDGYQTCQDDQAYCIEACMPAMRAQWHREAVASELVEKMKEVVALSWELSDRYRDANDAAPDHPTAVLEYAQLCLEDFGKGRDSGFREAPVILTVAEARAAHWTLTKNLIHRRMEFNDVREKFPNNPFLCGTAAKECARAGVALLAFEAAQERSE